MTIGVHFTGGPLDGLYRQLAGPLATWEPHHDAAAWVQSRGSRGFTYYRLVPTAAGCVHYQFAGWQRPVEPRDIIGVPVHKEV